MCLAQKDTTLSIQIKDLNSRQAVAHWPIQLINTTPIQYTDSEGWVVFNNLKKGTIYYFTTDGGHGHQPASDSLIVFIHTQTKRLKETELFAHQHLNINNKDVAQASDKIDKDFTQKLESIAGVSVQATGSNIRKPILNGMSGARLQLVSNGVRQEGQQWGSDHAPEIGGASPSTIRVGNIVTGLKYGTDDLGGSILIESLPITKSSTLKGKIGISYSSQGHGLQGFSHIEKSFGKDSSLSVRIAGAYAMVGNGSTPQKLIANSGYSNYQWTIEAIWRKKQWQHKIQIDKLFQKFGIYSGSHTTTLSDLQGAIKSDTPLVSASFTYNIQRPFQQVHHLNLNAKSIWMKNEKSVEPFINLQIDDRKEFDIVRSTTTQEAQLNLNLQTINYGVNYVNYQNALQFKTGVQQTYQTNLNGDGSRSFVANYSLLRSAFFTTFETDLGAWHSEFGYRMEHQYLTNYYNIGSVVHRFILNQLNHSLAGYFVYQNEKPWSIALEVALKQRSPNSAELLSKGLHHGAARMEYGDTLLRKETSFNVKIKNQWNFKKTSFFIETYAHYIKDFINLQPDGEELTVSGHLLKFVYAQTNALLLGINAQLLYEISHKTHFSMTASSLWGRDITKRDWLLQMPPNQINLSINHQLIIIGKSELEPFVDLSFRMKQANIPADFHSVDLLAPPSSYALLSIGARSQWRWKKTITKMELKCLNLTNQKSRDYLNSFRYFYDNPGRTLIVNTIINF